MDVRIDVIKKKTWRKSGESGRSSVVEKNIYDVDDICVKIVWT